MDQPRVPAGSPEGGQFASKDSRYGRYNIDPTPSPNGHVQPNSEQMKYIVEYQDNSSRINGGLRRGKTPEGTKELDEAIAANPLQHKVLYRVVKKHHVSDIAQGSIIKDAAFLSTTSSPTMAKLMCGDEGENALLTIRCPEGRRAMDMNRVQAVAGVENPYQSLEEILLQRNTQMRVLSISGKEVECEWL